ncbi:hypothetical protein [Amycolatopsis sacchari]|uniref:hypothetical protein n=1 Tax=Amycolatopsis sacchari TaxID=115433 RepID=UPI003D73B03E
MGKKGRATLLPTIGLIAAALPALCWLIYRLAVLRHPARVYDVGGAKDVEAMARAVKTALPPVTNRFRSRPGPHP